MIKDFKEGSDVVFEVTAEYVINISNIRNSRTTNVVKFAETIRNVIDITRFSSLNELIIVTGYIIPFVNNLKGTLKNDKANILLENKLTGGSHVLS